MSTNEIQITTEDKSVTVSVIDDADLTIDRILLYLFKNYYASVLAGGEDGTPVIPKSIKNLLIKEVEKKK